MSTAGLRRRVGGDEEGRAGRGRPQRQDPVGRRGVRGRGEIAAGVQKIPGGETQLLPRGRCRGDLRLEAEETEARRK